MIVMYKEPAEEDKARFDDHYFNVHVPLCQKYPGLVSAEVNRLTGAATGKPPYYLISELTFNSKADLDAALASPEGKAVYKDTRNFPPVDMTVAFAEVVK
ncbi:MAG TPA: EthD family reductase [Chloroflexia bacterium]|nr:EthD family reductase [Chloroflexia bacterium]